MIIVEYTTNTKVPAAELWNKLIDVQHWRAWDETVEFAELEEPIGAESIGLLKHKEFEPTSFMVLEYDHMKKIVEVRKSYFGKYKLSREITKQEEGKSEFVQKIEMVNSSAIVFSPFIASNLKQALVKSIENLEEICHRDCALYEAV